MITCNFCGDTYPEFDVAHVCSSGRYAPKMQNKLRQIAGASLDKSVPYTWTKLDYDQIHELLECHGRMLVQEHLDLLRREWYTLNNTPSVEGEAPRDIGLRVGSKSQIIVLMEKIKKHFGVGDE